MKFIEKERFDSSHINHRKAYTVAREKINFNFKYNWFLQVTLCFILRPGKISGQEQCFSLSKFFMKAFDSGIALRF